MYAKPNVKHACKKRNYMGCMPSLRYFNVIGTIIIFNVNAQNELGKVIIITTGMLD